MYSVGPENAVSAVCKGFILDYSADRVHWLKTQTPFVRLAVD